MNIYKMQVTVFFVLCLSLFGVAGENSSVLEGQYVQPVFNNQGGLIYVFKNNENKICLEIIDVQSEEPQREIIPLGEYAHSPLIKKDRNGQIWIVWEEREYDKSRIILGRLNKTTITDPRIISEQRGFDFSPELYFDLYDQPWIVWINYKDLQYRVFVQQVASQTTWTMNQPSLSTANTPQIIIDLNNHIWAFWTGIDGGEEEIFYRVFDQDEWSQLYRINQHNNFPSLEPSVVQDHKGFIWLIWSGYDGQDYEIFGTYWNGQKWSDEIKITNNHLNNDVFSSIFFTSENIPVVIWTKAEKEGSHIYVKFFKDGVWSKEIRVSDQSGQNVFPQVATEGQKIGIIWQNQGRIQAALFSMDQLVELDRRKEEKPLLPPILGSQIIFNPTLNENMYVGFGDSITYGFLDGKANPDKGYISRLQNILIQNFGEAIVLNEGKPSENTIGGLFRIDSVLKDFFARYVLIMEGSNDIHLVNRSMDTTAFHLKEMVRKCLAFGAFPAIATIIPRKDELWDDEFFRDRIFYLNEKIREIAAEFPIPLLEMFDLFYLYSGDEGDWRSLLGDNHHPSEKGYQMMAEEWFKEIKNFPFPPNNFRVERKYDEILFYREILNHVTWDDNFKIFDKRSIEGYKIYRKKEGDDQFTLLAVIQDELEYVDEQISPSENYFYIISTLRRDQVEGPSSPQIKDQ